MKERVILLLVLLLGFSISPSVNAYVEHTGGFITENETWRAIDNPHIVLALTTVRNNATLTIEPGVEVRFNPAATNPRLIIGEGGIGGTSGRLIARGTGAQPILFTSDSGDPQPGDWANIYFWPSAADDSIIEHAVIEYGGSSSQGSIHINGSSPIIRNCTVRLSAGSGISVSGSTSEISNCDINWNGLYGLHADDFSGILDENRFWQNGSYAIYFYLRDYTQPIVNVPNTFMGNNPDQIYFQGSSIRTDFRMLNFGIPYFISGLTTVQNNATLTIDPGVELRFNPASTNPRLIIGESGTGTSGGLIARGTASQPIIFTSDAADPEPGDWDNIVFRSNVTDDSIIEHAVIEYGGYPSQGSIYISGSSPAIQNCTVRFSADSGIHASGSASEISNCDINWNGLYGLHAYDFSGMLDENRFSQNGSYAIYLSLLNYTQPVVNVPNTFVGNNPDQIYFQGSSIRTDFRMINFGIPYFISGLTTVQNNATLTIEPGVELRFNPASTNPRLIIGESGTGMSGGLIAQGTESQKIIFTSDSDDPQPGDWYNIGFRSNATDDSIIEHAVIEYGGKSANQGSIYISGSSPTIRNCTIRFSADSGIHLYDSNTEISCTEIKHNSTGIHAALSNPVIVNNNFSGNVNYGLYNNSASVVDASQNWWGDPSGPGGVGPGSGDAVSSYVGYDPWLMEKSACILEPAMSVEPTAVDFGPVGIGDVSGVQIVSISNLGPGGLMIDGLDIAAGSDFRLADRSCLRRFLAADASCDVWLAFAPANIGDRIASLVISSNDPVQLEAVVDLTGQGQLVTDFDDDQDVDGSDLFSLAADPDLIQLSVFAGSFGRSY